VITAVCRRLAVVVFAVMCCGVLPVGSAFAQPSQPPKQAEVYVPLDQLPPQEQLPAARLLIAAYSVVIVVLFVYVASVARRLNTVQREVERIEADVKRTSRA
jgi:CcmD family protein